MQARYIILQVLALFLLVLIRKAIRFDRNGDNPEKAGATRGATSADIPTGLSPATLDQNEFSDHSG